MESFFFIQIIFYILFGFFYKNLNFCLLYMWLTKIKKKFQWYYSNILNNICPIENLDDLFDFSPHPALVVRRRASLLTERIYLSPILLSVFVPIWQDQGEVAVGEVLSSSASEGENRGCDLRRQIFGSWSLYRRWTWPSHLNWWTRTLFRMGVLYCSLLSKSAFETRSTYVMPAIRRSSFVSNVASRLESSTLTVHVSQPCLAIGMMMELNSLSFSFTEIRFCFHISVRALNLAMSRARCLFLSAEWLLSFAIWLPRYMKLSIYSISASFKLYFW